MLKTLWGEVEVTMTTVMVILKQVVRMAEHRFILQVTTPLLSYVPNSVLLFSAEQVLKLVKPIVYGIIVYFPVSLVVWSRVVCLPCGLVYSPFPHEGSFATCLRYCYSSSWDMTGPELCKVPSNWKQIPLSLLFQKVLDSHFQKWFRTTLKLFLWDPLTKIITEKFFFCWK